MFFADFDPVSTMIVINRILLEIILEFALLCFVFMKRIINFEDKRDRQATFAVQLK